MWSITEAPLKVIGTALGVGITLVGGTYKGFDFVDSHFAHQDDLEMVNMRLDEKVSSDRVNQVQQRIWMLEKEYGSDRNTWPQSVQQEVKELEVKKQKLDRHLDKIDDIMLQRGLNPSDMK